jgi:hypothetical protein
MIMKRLTDALLDSMAMAEFTGQSMSEWRKAHGVSRRTVYRWQQRADYRDRLSKTRTRVIEQVYTDLAVIARKAVKKLEHIMDHGIGEAIQLAAAKTLLTSLLAIGNYRSGQELVEQLTDRIAELENQRAQPVPLKITPPSAPSA